MALEYYDLEKTAELLKLSMGEVNRLRERGELRAFRDGSNWKFKRDDVEKFLTESIKNRSKAAAAQADDDFLSLADSDDEELPTLLADSASFDSLIPHNFMRDEEDGLVLADEDIDLGEEELGLGSEAKKPKVEKDDSDGDIFALADEDFDISTSEDSGLSLGSESDVHLAGDSGIDLAGESDVILEDDDLVLGGSGSGSDINIAGDSGLSLLDASDSGILGMGRSSGEGSDAILELADDDDILSLVEESDSDTATILTSDSDFQLMPEVSSFDTDDSESSSQVIALDDDPMFISDLEDSGPAMFSEDDPFASATMVPEGLPPMPGGPARPQQTAAFAPPNAADPFGGGASPFDSPDMQAAIQPVTPIVSQQSPSGANYNGLTMTFLICSMIFLSLALITSIDMVRWIWSWGEPFTLTGLLLDTIAGVLPL